jgi:hypothetical protein
MTEHSHLMRLDLIPSCLEEDFPRYATATEKFPPGITKENIRQRYDDYQCRIIGVLIVRRVAFAGALFNPTLSLFTHIKSWWSYRTSTSWIPVRYMTMVFTSAVPVALTWSLIAALRVAKHPAFSGPAPRQCHNGVLG